MEEQGVYLSINVSSCTNANQVVGNYYRHEVDTTIVFSIVFIN